MKGVGGNWVIMIKIIQSRYKNKAEKEADIFLASLLGAIIGALLVIFTIPTLSKLDILPYTIEANNQQAVTDEEHATSQDGITSTGMSPSMLIQELPKL